MSKSPLITGTGMGIFFGLLMVMAPWAINYPHSILGKILITMLGFFLVLGTMFLFIASLSTVRG